MKKNIIKLAVLLFIALFFNHTAYAQESEQSQRKIEIGLRLGETRTNALAIDATFPQKNNRIRSNFTFLDFSSAAGIYNFITPLGKFFQLHYGAGITVNLTDITSNIDIDPVMDIGFEYKFSEAPISLGFDWQPTYRSRLQSDAFAFSLRYRFK